MRLSILGLLLLLLLAAHARAQGGEPPPIPVKRGKQDGLRMIPRDEPDKEKGKEEKEPEKDPEKKAEPKDPFTAGLERLATWPSEGAREAAAEFAIQGPELEQKLLQVLPTAKPELAAGLCFVLGDIGGEPGKVHALLVQNNGQRGAIEGPLRQCQDLARVGWYDVQDPDPDLGAVEEHEAQVVELPLDHHAYLYRTSSFRGRRHRSAD